VKIREVKDADIVMAWGQDGHLSLAKYVTHDYRSVVEHERINLWDLKRHLRQT
jgi:hypothetical protein